MTLKLIAAIATVLFATVSTDLAHAASVTAEGGLVAVSDYRFRGLSLSDRRPALQADLTVSHKSGAYVSVFASTIDEYGQDASGKGATVELDYTAGWAFAAAGLDFDVAASAYTYPGGVGVNYVELPAQASKTLGAWTGSVGFAYAPEQHALDRDNWYLWTGLDYNGAALPMALSARIGREDGAFADQKTDWSLSASRTWGHLQASAAYVDSDQGGGGLVLSLAARF
ncbi:TorF family putative porin [Caulobacter sp. LARHSG274]